jgi:dTDP-4-amino-4,6-dideoxygalactose transaminase
MRIPFIDLAAQYDSIKEDVDKRLHQAISSFQFCRGKEVNEFESSFAELLNVSNCVSTGNGTDALFLSLKSLGISASDEVITPAFSWISSAEVISLCSALPVFADVDHQTYTLDPADVRKKITAKTKAIIAVHLYGHIAHVTELLEICREYNLYLIEDCAQAHLSQEGNKYSGTFGDTGAFSFYPTKNLGAYGDAGCVITPHTDLAEKIRRLSNHGALQKDDHVLEGMNSRMDTLQAAVLLAKLPHLVKWNERRQELAKKYLLRLAEIPEVTLPYTRKNTTHSFHLFVIRAQQRDALKKYLEKEGIQTIVHYPSALTNLSLYRKQNELFPVSSALEKEVISLPLYPELSSDSIDYICIKIKEFYSKHYILTTPSAC